MRSSIYYILGYFFFQLGSFLLSCELDVTYKFVIFKMKESGPLESKIRD